MNKISSTFLIILIFISCKKNNDKKVVKIDDKKIDTIQDSQLILISPIYDTLLLPCSNSFKWKSNNDSSNYRFTISQNSRFDTILFDTILYAKNYFSKFNFQPEKKYFWRVIQDSDTAKSTFQIKNVIGNMNGLFVASISKYNWEMTQGISNLISFDDTIGLYKEGDKIHFIYTDENIDRLLEYNNFYNPNELFYRTNYYGSSGATLFYNFYNDSVRIQNKLGGLGSGTKWDFKLKI